MGLQPVIEPLADAIGNALRGFLCQENNWLQRLAGLLIYPETVVDPTVRFPLELLAPRSCPPRQGATFPVQGGQCEGVLYRVPFTRIAPNGTQLQSEFQNVVGPITGVGGLWLPDGFGALGYYVQVFAPNDTEPNPLGLAGQRLFGPSSYADNDRASQTVLGPITRMDGGPDNCGDGQLLPPVNPPPNTPISLPPINIDIGGVNVNFDVDVNLNPVINLPDFGGLHIPVTVNIAPNIIVPGGLRTPIYFRLPDLTVNLAPSFNWDINTVINLPGVQRPCPLPPNPGSGCECQDVREIVRQELDEKFPPRRPNENRFEVYEAADSRLINLPQFSEWVQINLVDIPVNAKRQPGMNAPDVIYAGWYSFGINGAAGDRLPIHYQSQTVKVPEGATTFSYTVYIGFSATLTIRYREES